MPQEPNTEFQDKPAGWERELLMRLAQSSLVEQRRARRWGIFFKLLIFGYVMGALFVFGNIPKSVPGMDSRHTAVVELNGIIAPEEEGGADNVVAGLREAFENKHAAGVILRINSPGGSPVQSAYIYDEIKRLRGEHPDMHLYVVIADVCASGGMYVASAAEKIYANPSSLVGSIGVRMDGFGFVDTMEKLGVERRLVTAGEHKGLLDPFLPVDPTEEAHVRKMLAEVHAQFIASVKAGRGDRLADDEDLFTGLVWTGQKAKELGLIDDFGSASYVAREVIGVEEMVNYTIHKSWIDRVAGEFGASIGRGFAQVLATPVMR